MVERLRILMEKENLTTKSLEERTGIDRYKWGNLLNGKNRMNEDHIQALKKGWPQYIFWLVTGDTIPEGGQISPNEAENKPKEIGNENDQQQQHDDFDHPALLTSSHRRYHRPGAEEETKSEGP